MTAPVCVRQRIRQLDRQGLSHKEISRRLGVSRTTVVRYANHGDYSPRPSTTARLGGSRWSMTGTRPSWMAGRTPMCACRSSNAISRPACTSGSWRNAGIRRCGVGSSVGGRSIERSRTASPSWSGRREARRSISARPGPWSRAWSGSCISWWCRSRIRTCAGWSPFPARPRSACARVCCGSSNAWAWRLGWWCSTTPPAWAIAGRTARPPRPACSPCSARITGSSRGSATRIPAMRRAVWRTPSASSGAT